METKISNVQNLIKFLGLKTNSDCYKVLYSNNFGSLKVKRFNLNQKGLQEANLFIEGLKKNVVVSDQELLK